MELHTLGVTRLHAERRHGGGALLHGWTIDKPRQYADFKFDDRLHDPDPEIRAGEKDPRGRMKDGEQSLSCSCITRIRQNFFHKTGAPVCFRYSAAGAGGPHGATFQSSDGDIRAVLKTMIWSPEFWSRESYRAKIKTPFELVVSEVRALGTDVDTPLPLVQWVGRIGEPLYQCQPPTGYADKADAW